MASAGLAQHAIGSCITAFFHPIGYTKTLIQIGHEPLPPVQVTTWFGKNKLCYPSVIKYIRHIKKMDGFFGLYRGLLPRILGGTVGNVVQSLTAEQFKALKPKEDSEEKGEDDELVNWLKAFCLQTSEETLCRCAGIICSQPFHVIMIRQMAQFVGGEKEYDGLFSSITEIYHNDGISGYFAGIIPRLIGEVFTIWLSNFIAHLVNKYLIESKEMKSYTAAATGLVISHITYPFTLVGNIMAVTGAELVVSKPPKMPIFANWRDCWRNLSEHGQLKRGSSMFWRYYNGPVKYSNNVLIPLKTNFFY